MIAQIESDVGIVQRQPLAMAIVVLAFLDGVIHLSLDWIFFQGQLLADMLSVLFVLTFLGYLGLIAAFVLSAQSSRWQRLAIDLIMIGYAAVAFFAWLAAGRPNPLNLGYLSKAIEVALIVALIVHIGTTFDEV